MAPIDGGQAKIVAVVKFSIMILKTKSITFVKNKNSSPTGIKKGHEISLTALLSFYF
jgi:hypothetical protein